MHNRLENYLNQLRSQLQSLPPEKREAELREIRSHLEKLVADHRREGMSEEAALDKAFEQFGSSRTNGRALRRAWNRVARSPLEWMVLGSWGLVTGLLFMFFFAVGPVSPLPGVATSSNSYALADQTHQREIQSIQQRLNADDLALQRMNLVGEAGVKARFTAINRFQTNMNAANMRWQDDIQVAQRQSLSANLSFFSLSALAVAVIFLASLRVLRTRRFNSLSVG